MAGKIKKKQGEKLDFADVAKMLDRFDTVVNPIKWTEACDMLNIAHNKPRLMKIINIHKDDLAKEEKLRAANRGKPAQAHEIKYIIEQYLEGTALAEIANQLYRPSSFVKNIVEMVGVPTRGVGETYVNFGPLPEQCISDKFENGEIAWSAKYHAPCVIQSEWGPTVDNESTVYSIMVIEPYEEPEVKYARYNGTHGGFYAYQPAYDLGKLDHLKQYGVDISRKL